MPKSQRLYLRRVILELVQSAWSSPPSKVARDTLPEHGRRWLFRVPCSAMDCIHLAHSVESNRGGAVHSPQVSRKSGNIRSIIIHMGTDLDALGCGARCSLETARNTCHTRSPRSRGA